MFDDVAEHYDAANSLLTVGIQGYWRRAVTRIIDPRPGERILDVAAGTGASSAPLAAVGADVTASDFSQGMIEVGRERHPELEFVQADVTAMPFADNSFDTVTISFGLRNVQDTAAALREMARVTRPGGKIVVCEFSKVTTPVVAPAYHWYIKHVLPAVAGALSRDNKDAYKYLVASIDAWYAPSALSELMLANGWIAPQFRRLTAGIVAVHRAYKAHPSRNVAAA